MKKVPGLAEHHEVFGEMREVFLAAVGQPYHVLRADAELAGDVNAGLNRDDGALGENSLVGAAVAECIFSIVMMEKKENLWRFDH